MHQLIKSYLISLTSFFLLSLYSWSAQSQAVEKEQQESVEESPSEETTEETDSESDDATKEQPIEETDSESDDETKEQPEDTDSESDDEAQEQPTEETEVDEPVDEEEKMQREALISGCHSACYRRYDPYHTGAMIFSRDEGKRICRCYVNPIFLGQATK